MKVAGCKLRFSSTLLEAHPKHVERKASALSKPDAIIEHINPAKDEDW